ncbi:MAG: AraC family transcriptional regulator [Verrucomicrobiota bacterium]
MSSEPAIYKSEKEAIESSRKSTDPLGEALHSLRMGSTFYCRSELTAPWGMDLPPMEDTLMFHIVTAGSCWVDIPGVESRLLRVGDFALAPQGTGHVIKSDSSAEAVPLFDLPRVEWGDRYEHIRFGGGGAETGLVCGAVHFQHPTAIRLIQMLPKIITIDASTPGSDWMLSTIRLMISEAQEMRPGGDTVIQRVSDILVIQAIRSWLDNDPKAKTGWLGALQDEQIGKAIMLVHRDPIAHWTVASLAESVGMSRSSFAAKFMELVGEGPMQYVRHWRMQVAVTWLRETDDSVGEMAERLGYQSEAAFNRAFKNFIGVTPGAVRRSAA